MVNETYSASAVEIRKAVYAAFDALQGCPAFIATQVRVHRGSGCCAREIVPEFHGIIRRRAAAELSSWIERARAILIASFLRGVTNDEAAVRAALNRKCSTHWSGARGSG